MPNPSEPYVPHNPGDLITSEDWNDVQIKIKEDIAAQTKKAIDGITQVPNADNAAKLENKTAEELALEIIKRALQEIAAQTGYRMLFKVLKFDDTKKTSDEQEPKVIKHNLKNAPLVDVYQLDYFPVFCSKDGEMEYVNFYLYHTTEKKIKNPVKGGAPPQLEIEPTNAPAVFKVPFKEMLDRFKVNYSDDSSLDDLVNEFWKAIFAEPNDGFEDQYCHSPWFDKCCCDERTVRDLKKRGDWDDIWFKMKPRKTINYLTQIITPPAAAVPPALKPTDIQPAPTQIQVVHFDFNSVGLKLLAPPVYTKEIADFLETKANEIKLMVLLKV